MKEFLSKLNLSKSIHHQWLVVVFMVLILIFILISLFVFINWNLIENLYLKSSSASSMILEHNLDGIIRVIGEFGQNR